MTDTIAQAATNAATSLPSSIDSNQSLESILTIPLPVVDTSQDPAAAPPTLDKATFSAIGSYLFDTINIVFDAYPNLDELGLLLGMPSGGGGRKAEAEQQGKPIECDPCLREYHQAHPPPAAFLELQATNASPPFIVVEASKIGISFWAIPFIIKYTIRRFQQARAKMHTERLTAQMLVERARLLGHVGQLHTEFLHCTRILLLINADNYTAWNVRKMLLAAEPLHAATQDVPAQFLLSPSTELRLLNLIYSKHPKSGESWNHRRWVLSFIEGFDSCYHFTSKNVISPIKHSIESVTLLTTPSTTSTTATSSTESSDSSHPPHASLYHTSLFQSELRMSERSAELYPKNYFAWMHRQWLVERLTDRLDLLSELERAGEWTESHINDYCGFFHRQVCWNHLLTLIATRPQQTKGDSYASVHKNLVQQLRSWSKKYPLHPEQHSTSSSSAASALSTPSSSSISASVATPTSPSPPSSDSRANLHAALASCSFCSLFSTTEWSHLNELQLKYPGHETLWMYRRFVWHATIWAIQQHDTSSIASTHTTSSPASPSSASATIPSWLQPLIQRELDYAAFQIQDHDLSNYEANKSFATIYQVWILQDALTLVYQANINDQTPVSTTTAPSRSSSPTSSAASTTFPLFPHLSSSHRLWYLNLLNGINQLRPTVMSHNHWQQRTEAIANTTTKNSG